MEVQKNRNHIAPALPFLIGGLSGAIATFCIQPIDTLKVQIQVISQQIGRQRTKALSIPSILIRVKDNQGLTALYRGLDSAILRQIFYASARIGAYQSSLKHYQELVNRKSNSMEKIAFSMLSGAFGAVVGNPFDVALIRRQASLATNKHHYRSTLQAFRSIVKNEGVVSLWRGINITIWRVVVINLGQLAGKDIISEELSQLEISKEARHNLTALLASLLTAGISLPIDNIKVKLQKQDQASESYRGILDCLLKSVRREGVLRLWVGLPVYFIRGTPHSFILLRCQQYLSQLWRPHRQE